MTATIAPQRLSAVASAQRQVYGVVSVVTDASGNGTVSVVLTESANSVQPVVPIVTQLTIVGTVGGTTPIGGTPSVQAVVGTAAPIGTIIVVVHAASVPSGTVLVAVAAQIQE